MRVLTFIGLFLLCGCRTELLGMGAPLGGSDGGDNVDLAQSVNCAQIMDQAGCDANSNCESSTTCDGSVTFLGCYDKGTSPGVKCPPLDCTTITRETACLANSACVAVTLCGNGEFQGCVNPDSPGPMFGPFCYTTRCGSHADEASCTADSSCHAIFLLNPLTFSKCARGVAECSPPNSSGSCQALEPACVDPFVPEYDGQTGCIVDCVRNGECPQS